MAIDGAAVKAKFQSNFQSALNNPNSGISIPKPNSATNPTTQQSPKHVNTGMSEALNNFKSFTPVAQNNNQPFQFKAPEPFKYDQNSDPLLQNAIASAKANIAQQQSDTNAFLRARGQGKSSYSETVANQIADKEMGNVTTNILPQLISQAYQRYNDAANRDLSIQQANYGVQRDSVDDTYRDADLTGSYLPANARAFIDRITELGEAWKTGNADERAAYHDEAELLRAKLAGMNIDPTLFGADKTTEQRLANVAKAGIPTLAGKEQQFNQDMSTQQFDFQKAQQEWENNFNQGQFDWNKAQTAWENAFKTKSFEQDMKEAAASRGLQWASLDQRQKEFIADQAFREKQFKYQQDQDLLSNRDKPANLSDKDSANNYNLIFDDINADDITKEEARTLLQSNSQYLSDSDYKKLNDYINDNL